MENISLTVLGLAGLLGLAALMLPAARRLQIPYTVLLAIIGTVLGGANLLATGSPGSGFWNDFLFSLKNIEITSEAVLFIFIPALVFESALSINTHRLEEDLIPILILAVVGLLLSTFIIGVSLHWASSAAFVTCLLLGAILSATDPVAVVAIFKELQAPKRLAILVEGESLFNDATAIVLFTLLSGMLLQTSQASWISGVVAFSRVFLGGVVTGLAGGWLVCLIFKWLGKFPVVKVTLTISLAYLSFVVAEHYFHVSGVMAVVSSALVLGSRGRSVIAPETWNTLKEIWEYIGFGANSLIFILVGLVIPEIIAKMDSSDLGLLAAVVVSAFGARAVILYGLLPLFAWKKWVGAISTAFKTVMFWGGLRGAVSLALGLAVMENPDYSPEVRHFVGVLVTGFVLFTLLVNATTIGLVIRFFGLNRLTPADRAIRTKAMEITLRDLSQTIQSAAKDFQVSPDLTRDVVARYRQRVAGLEEEWNRMGAVTSEDWRRIGLANLTHQEREEYLKLFEGGWIDSRMARMLLVRAEDLLDAIRAEGLAGYEASWKKRLQFDWRLNLGQKLMELIGVSGWLGRYLSDRFEIMIFQRRVLEILFTHNLPKLSTFLGAELAGELEEVLNQRLNSVEQALYLLKLQYPAYARLLEKRYLEKIALRLEDAEFRDMLENSLISREVFRDLENELEMTAGQLEKRPQLDLGLEPKKLVARVPLFSECSQDQLEGIAQLLRPRLAVPGERIIQKGQKGEAMYFISSGSVEVRVEPHPVFLGSGDFFGEIALVKELTRTADVLARSYCNLLVLKRHEFKHFMANHPDLESLLERTASERLEQGEFL